MKKKINKYLSSLKKILRKCYKQLKIYFLKFKKWQYYKISLIVMAVLGLLIIIFIITLNINKTYKDEFNQYILGKRFNYEATYKINKNNHVFDYEIKDADIAFEKTPVFFDDKNKILFFDKSSIVFLDNYHQYYLDGGFILEKKKDNYLIDNKKYDDFIIFNGDNLYFFSEETILHVGEEVFKLPKSSYCLLWNNSTIEYYNSKSKESELIEFSGNVYALIGDVKVNLSLKSVSFIDKEYLLQTRLENLKKLGDKNE